MCSKKERERERRSNRERERDAVIERERVWKWESEREWDREPVKGNTNGDTKRLLSILSQYTMCIIERYSVSKIFLFMGTELSCNM